MKGATSGVGMLVISMLKLSVSPVCRVAVVQCPGDSDQHAYGQKRGYHDISVAAKGRNVVHAGVPSRLQLASIGWLPLQPFASRKRFWHSSCRRPSSAIAQSSLSVTRSRCIFGFARSARARARGRCAAALRQLRGNCWALIVFRSARRYRDHTGTYKRSSLRTACTTSRRLTVTCSYSLNAARCSVGRLSNHI